MALAYGQCAMIQIDCAFLKALESKEKKEFVFMKKDSKDCMNIFFKLSALFKIQQDIGTWYEHGYLTADHGEMIRAEIKNLLRQMKKYVVPMVDFIPPSDDLNDVMIAPEDGDLYGNIVKQLYSSPGVFQRISNWEEIVRKPKL